MNIKTFLWLFLVLVLASCDPSPVTSDYRIPKEELKQVMDKADRGDLDAITRLIWHYDTGVPGDEVMFKSWREKARSLNDPVELYNFSTELLTEAYRENDAKKRSELLLSALEHAERARLNNKDKRKQDESIMGLIDEIKKAQ